MDVGPAETLMAWDPTGAINNRGPSLQGHLCQGVLQGHRFREWGPTGEFMQGVLQGHSCLGVLQGHLFQEVLQGY